MKDSEIGRTGVPTPQEALGTCHRCIAAMLDRLESLAAELARPAVAADLSGIANALVAEIDEALGVHMIDEENDMFPAVLAAADSPARRAQAFALVSSLLVEHRELAELWHALRIALLALGSGVCVPFPGGTAMDFLAFARSHLERENYELAELMGVVDPARSQEIAISIAHRHGDACPRAEKGSESFPRK
jgi:hypothetical protein